MAEHDPERANGEGAGAPESNGGASEDLGEWAEDEATFTEDAEFFHYMDDLEDDEEDEEGEGELVETVDEFGRRHVRRAAPEGTEQILENEAPRRIRACPTLSSVGANGAQRAPCSPLSLSASRTSSSRNVKSPPLSCRPPANPRWTYQ